MTNKDIVKAFVSTGVGGSVIWAMAMSDYVR